MGQTGRPTKFNDEVTKTILNYIRAGAYIETAVAAAGIAKSTFQEWLKKGAAQKSGKFRDFSDAIQQANAQDELNGSMHLASLSRKQVEKKFKCEKCSHENTVSVPVPGNVQLEATKWRLQHRHPAHFGNKVTVAHEGAEAIAEGFDMVQEAMARKKRRD